MASGSPQIWIGAEFSGGRLHASLMDGRNVLQSASASAADTGVLAAARGLAEELAPAGPVPIVAAGLAEAGTAAVPAKPAELQPVRLGTAGEYPVFALPGLRQDSPAAVMRAAATRTAGFLSLNGGWDGVLCLPGQTTHWVHVSAGEAVSFQSFLTLPLAGLALGAQTSAAASHEALAEGAAESISRPERLASRLAEFQARSSDGAKAGPQDTGWLWGVVLGAELAAARPYWLGQNVALIGEAGPAALYEAALSAQGIPLSRGCAQDTLLAGLELARPSL